MNGSLHVRRMASAALVMLASAPSVTVAQESSGVVRILAYNVRHGAGMDDRVDLDRAAAVINRLQPDIVALQEIDSATTRTGRIDQAASLGAATGMHHAFGAFMPYREGAYGMAILSRFPIDSVVNLRLPDGAEPRSALAVTIDVGDVTPWIVVGIHLYASEAERIAQAETLTAMLADERRPVFLVGDFNSQPASPVIALLGRHWNIPAKRGDPLTFPADVPDREIDYIMLRPVERFDVVNLQVIDEPLASDHRPILMDVRVRKVP